MLARTSRLPSGVRLAFFDGEVCFREYGPDDGLVGSRFAARRWEADGELARARAMILLDMIGDRDLTLTLPTNGDPRLTRLAYDTATRLGMRRHVTSRGMPVLDDHVPFARRGVPSIDLIDFEYGTRPLANDLWHTGNYTLEHVSPEGMRQVGRLTLGMLAEIMTSPEFAPRTR